MKTDTSLVTVNHVMAIRGAFEAENGVDRMVAVAWAPNNRKLAAFSRDKDRVIYLYDEHGEPRDRFPSRPAELPKKGQPVDPYANMYSVSSLAFSPDSTKIAVGQTDGIIFIYKVGEDFKMKKTITNKLAQPSPVTFLIWPNEFEIICGLYDGKLRHTPVVAIKGPRSRTFYNAESYNIALICDAKSTEIASAHVDGKIAVFLLENSELPALKYVITHSCPAFGLAFGNNHILAGGCDCKIGVYEEGTMIHQFDFSRDEKDRDFVSACGSPSGLAVVFGGYDRLRILRWIPRKKIWEEGPILDIPNLYAISSLAWNREGTRIIAGTMIGGLHLFETVLRRMRTEDYEVEFATPFTAIVNIIDPPMSVNLESKKKLEILDVKVMGKERYAIAVTLETMIICDIERSLISEIRWDNTEDEEQFYFDNPNACMIFHNGEMTLVEYGNPRILGTFRTEFVNPHMISVRINERIPMRHADQVSNKKLAYLVDQQTATIVDLVYNANLGHVTHDCNIDWMELNETAVKLLFRDRRLRLVLVDIDSMEKHTILQLCNFVQWVPFSDVIVAQSKKNLCIWYNVDTPDQFVEIETNGLAFDVSREPLQSNVLVQDGNTVHEITLDSSRIEFGTAMMDGDYIRAMLYLEIAERGGETRTMWKQLSKDAIEAKELRIAERAACACGDISKAKYLADTVDMAEMSYIHGVQEDAILGLLQARIAVLNEDLATAENIFLENENTEGVVHMFTSIHKWKEALKTVGDKNPTEAVLLCKQYMKYLISTKQDEVIAEFMEEQGNHDIAAIMFLRCGLPIKAARVVQNHISTIKLDKRFISDLGAALTNSGCYIEAAEFYDSTGHADKALEYYRKSQQFEHALRIAKKSFPGEVVVVEEEWADYLFEQRNMELASNHYIEAHRIRKAVEAAIEGKLWEKAMSTIQTITDAKSVAQEYVRIGDYYQQTEDFRTASLCYMKAEQPKLAVSMYMNQGLWKEAFEIAVNSAEGPGYLEQEFKAQADVFIRDRNYREAESIYCAMLQPDMAITMYSDAEMYDEMLRLVEIYHPTHLMPAYEHLARTLSSTNTKAAEIYYLKVGAVEKALNMYIEKGMWEDALRVGKSHDGGSGFKRVVYLWAQSVGAELGYKLLKRFNFVEECLDYLCEHESFDFALELAPYVGKDKVKDIHIRYAQYLVRNEAFEEAANSYISGGEAELAVNMYMNMGNFDVAMEIAEDYCREKLDNVYLKYAEVLFKQKHYGKFETVMLKAQRPDLAIQLYKDNNMWMEAFKLCKDYAPRLLDQLQRDFDKSTSSTTRFRDDIQLVNQGNEFEIIGENKAAIECYLKLGDSGNADHAMLLKYWQRGAELALNFFKDSYGEGVVTVLAGKLGSIGFHAQAAALLADIGKYGESLEELIAGEQWEDAERTASEIGPEMVDYVRECYTAALRKTKSVEKLSNVNLPAALEYLQAEGQWEELLNRARVDPQLLFTYLEKYVTILVEERDPMRALEMYSTYGVCTWREHIRAFENLVFCYFQEVDTDQYSSNLLLRNTTFKFMMMMERDSDSTEDDLISMNGFLNMTHLIVNRSAFREVPGLEELGVKTTLSLLRYTDILPPERLYFEAAFGCKSVGWLGMGFVFMNHYMDIFEAVEAGHQDTSGIDYSEFAGTDIPTSCPLPGFHVIEPAEHEEARDWILAVSMDRNVFPELRTDHRGVYEGSLRTFDKAEYAESCVITGYPAIMNPVKFMDTDKLANKSDYEVFCKALSKGDHPALQEIQKFLIRWSRRE